MKKNEKKIVKKNGKNFEVPSGEICCEKCGTTNFIYNDMKPPYKCDDCGSPLDAADMSEIDMDELQYEHDEGKYDGQV
jgi:predicted Zn-ribbon and HTH transcriptional regulator